MLYIHELFFSYAHTVIYTFSIIIQKEALDSYQKRIRDMEEEVKVLNDRLHQDQVKQVCACGDCMHG